MKRAVLQIMTFLLGSLITLVATSATNPSVLLNQQSPELIKILEIVIAGIVASAIILSLFAFLVGHFSNKKQNKAIKRIREELSKDKDIVDDCVEDIKTDAIEVRELLNNLKNKTSSISTKQHQAWVQVEEIEQMTEEAVDNSSELKQTSENFNQRMTQILNYWDTQLGEASNIVQRVQQTLTQGLNDLESGFQELYEYEQKSRHLSQKVLTEYESQTEVLQENNKVSDHLRESLHRAFTESKHLLEQLNTYRQAADQSLQEFSSELGNFESQAYEEFDGVFQAADIARKELHANVDESRLHVENLRRYESEGRDLKTRSSKYLTNLDTASIKDFANTLESTQQMFSNLQNDVQDAQYAIDSLRKMKHDILLGGIDENDVADTETKAEKSEDDKQVNAPSNTSDHMESGLEPEEENNTLISFFSPRK